MRLDHGLIWIPLLLGLAGCNALQTKPDIGQAGLQEIEQRAQLAYEKEDWKAAEQDYQYLTVHTPERFEPWFRLGNIYARNRQFDAAVNAYRKALSREQKSSKAWHNLGVVQLRQATETFLDMLQHTSPGDPLRTHAEQTIITVTRLMESGFNAQNTE